MKSKSQQRREAVMKTGKLPKLPKNWGKVKGTTAFDPPVKPVKWKPKASSSYWVREGVKEN